MSVFCMLASWENTHTETIQKIAVPHIIPWISGKRQPPNKKYIYMSIRVCVYIYTIFQYKPIHSSINHAQTAFKMSIHLSPRACVQVHDAEIAGLHWSRGVDLLWLGRQDDLPEAAEEEGRGRLQVIRAGQQGIVAMNPGQGEEEDRWKGFTGWGQHGYLDRPLVGKGNWVWKVHETILECDDSQSIG